MPRPAPFSIINSCLWETSSRTDVGVRPTRYSCVLSSFGTPTITCRLSSLHLREGLRDGGLLADLHLGDLVAMHLVRAVGEAERARMRVRIGEAEVLGHAAAAMHLHGPIDDLAGDVRREHLDHGDLLLRDLVSDRIHLPGCIENHEAGGVYHDARLG